LDQLLAGRDPPELFPEDGLLDGLKKALSEMDAVGRAGRSPGIRDRNRRGKSPERVIEKDGADGLVKVTLDIPRDRCGTFNPRRGMIHRRGAFGADGHTLARS
jgi:putative transposase